jgi:hypothetical protein
MLIVTVHIMDKITIRVTEGYENRLPRIIVYADDIQVAR